LTTGRHRPQGPCRLPRKTGKGASRGGKQVLFAHKRKGGDSPLLGRRNPVKGDRFATVVAEYPGVGRGIKKTCLERDSAEEFYIAGKKEKGEVPHFPARRVQQKELMGDGSLPYSHERGSTGPIPEGKRVLQEKEMLK